MLLTLVAIGTYFIVRSAAKMNAMNQLLEEEDYTRQKKHENKKMSGPDNGLLADRHSHLSCMELYN